MQSITSGWLPNCNRCRCREATDNENEIDDPLAGGGRFGIRADSFFDWRAGRRAGLLSACFRCCSGGLPASVPWTRIMYGLTLWLRFKEYLRSPPLLQRSWDLPAE